jgi:hypothetical protein
VRRVDIESLLNPAGESHVLTETSDKEIYQAVIDSIGVAALACENISGDEDIPIKPRPTRHDIRKAVSTIGRYIDGFSRANRSTFGFIQQAAPP